MSSGADGVRDRFLILCPGVLRFFITAIIWVKDDLDDESSTLILSYIMNLIILTYGSFDMDSTNKKIECFDFFCNREHILYQISFDAFFFFLPKNHFRVL